MLCVVGNSSELTLGLLGPASKWGLFLLGRLQAATNSTLSARHRDEAARPLECVTKERLGLDRLGRG